MACSIKYGQPIVQTSLRPPIGCIGQHDDCISYLEDEQRVPINGQNCTIFGQDSKIFGQDSKIFGQDSKIFGQDSKIFGQDSTIFGQDSKIFGQDSTIFDQDSTIFGQDSKIFGQESTIFVGPAGSGKSRQLLKCACQFLADGNVILVLSTWKGSYLASFKLYEEIIWASFPSAKQTLAKPTTVDQIGIKKGKMAMRRIVRRRRAVRAHTSKERNSFYEHLASSRKKQNARTTDALSPFDVRFYHCLLYDKNSLETVKQSLMQTKANSKVCVVMDNCHDGPEFDDLCRELLQEKHVTILAAARDRHCSTAKSLNTVHLNAKLRPFFGPPISPGEDQRVRVVRHKDHGPTKEPKDCQNCGRQVAQLLRAWGLGLNLLRHRDVFILVRNDAVSLDTDLGFLTGLQTPAESRVGRVQLRSDSATSPGFPVRVLTDDFLTSRTGDTVDDIINDVALDRGPDVITMATEQAVRGLERKVVVWVGVGEGDYYDAYDRWYASACATECLVWVRAPHEVELEDGDDM